MTKTAVLFPGQGSQYVGMGHELYNEYGEARRIFEEASRVLDLDVATLCFSGPEEKLNLTQYTQPAILTMSMATYSLMERDGFSPDMVAGHSLGEYSALVAAGALRFTDAVLLVHKRGVYMQEALPPEEGLVVAIIGLERRVVEEICREAAGEGVVSVANYNSPTQIVIAGERETVELAMEIAKKRGAKRSIILPVSAPVHSPLMKEAAEKLSKEVEGIKLEDLRCPLVCNVDAHPIYKGEEARRSLIRQLTSSVLWEDSIRWMISSDVSNFIEVGPKDILSGLVKRIDKGMKTLHVEDNNGLKRVREIKWA